MRIAYYDESGDDGFRRSLRDQFGLPVKTEMHTKYFVLNKKPYRALELSEADRIDVVDLVCDLVGTLDARIINVVIVKPRIERGTYDVLDTAVKYSVQRIENDLDPRRDPNARFLLITDEGQALEVRHEAFSVPVVVSTPCRAEPRGRGTRR